nr:class I SAM-dependent methyltransferase [Nocardioides daedukensis]
MADHCGQSYQDWKSALIIELLHPDLGQDRDILEVAPGHGRFTVEMVDNCRSLTLVDLSPTCLEVCRSRFGDDGQVRYIETDGTSLPGVLDESIDFIWSFDSFVHMERGVIDAYLAEFARVLRPEGRFVIHHAGKREWSLRAVPLTRKLGAPGRVVQRLMSQGRLRDSGCRADVSAGLVGRLVATHGLEVVEQRNAWGAHGEFDLSKFGDVITVGRKP